MAIFPDQAADNGATICYQPLLESAWVRRISLEDWANQPVSMPGLRLVQLIMAKPVIATGLSLQVQKTVRGEPVEPRFLPINTLRQAQGERMERKS